jgi:hypothetical protein
MEAIGDAVGRNTMRGAGGRMRSDSGGVPGTALDYLVIVVGNSHENGQVSSALQIQNDARVLDGLPSRLENEPVLGIHVGRLARRDSEELRIELVDSVDESPTPGDGLAQDARLGIVEPFDIPPIRWNLTDSLTTFREELPKRFSVVNAAGESATDSNDGNTFFVHTIIGRAKREDQSFGMSGPLLLRLGPLEKIKIF